MRFCYFFGKFMRFHEKGNQSRKDGTANEKNYENCYCDSMFFNDFCNSYGE